MDAGEKVAVFIDGSNLYHALKVMQIQPQIDFQFLVRELVLARTLQRVYYYNARRNQAEDRSTYQRQQRFFDYVERLPYFEVKYGRLVRRGSTWREKGVDVLLATDMVAMGLQNRYDTAILISGDGDFKEAVQCVKNAGRHVELAYPLNPKPSDALITVCDKFTPLTTTTHIRPKPQT